MIEIVKRWFILQKEIEGFKQGISPYIYSLLKRKYELILANGNAIRVCNNIVIYIQESIPEIEAMNLGGDDSEITIDIKSLQKVFINYGGRLVTKREFIDMQVGVCKADIIRNWKELRVDSLDAFLWAL